MSKFISVALLAIGCLTSTLAAAEFKDAEVNLFRADKIEPAYIHGEVTAVSGYTMRDRARDRYIAKHRQNFSGEDCFKIDVRDGVMTLSFPDPLPAPYAENRGETIFFYIGVAPQPPAAKFHISGRVKLNKGAVRFRRGPKLMPNSDWQTVDYKGRETFIAVTPAPGARISMADLKMTPVYPAVGGEIALPNGGKLTHFLLPENPDFVTRWSVAMWRGWLWKMTGVALPIVTVREVKPTPGAFAAMRDRDLKRGWKLKVDDSGINLYYSENDDIVPALFDYLRLALGYSFYAPGCEKLPKLPVAVLPAFDRHVNPRYKAIVCGNYEQLFSGGKLDVTRYIRNDVDFYHLTHANWLHFLNIALPAERYFKDHPEYFMMDSTGNRVASFRPTFIHQCFSNPDGRRIMVEGLCDIVRAQKSRGLDKLCFESGDSELFCLCPKCVAFNGTRKTNTDLLMDFTNQVAAALKEIDPGIQIFRCAYLNRCSPPRKVKPADNVNIFYCLTQHTLPCALHADCVRNREEMKMLAAWKEALGGDASRVGFMTYDDGRPLQYVRMAEYLNQFGSGDFFMFKWHYTPVALQFVMSRWNLGEDANKLMEEFDLNYYGKAGKIMHELTLFIDEYGRNYRHKKHYTGEGSQTVLFSGNPGHSQTSFDRAALDRIYTYFDRALEAAGDDSELRARIFEEKKFVLAEDFIKYGPASCATDAELDAFIKRVVDFITMAREAPGRFVAITPDMDMRRFLLTTTGLAIPNTGKFWAEEPYVKKFLADPHSFFASADRIHGGWYFKPLAMRGADAPRIYNYECPARYSVALRRPPHTDKDVVAGYAPADAAVERDRSRVILTMNLEYTPKYPSFLAVEGQDDDKPGRSQMSVSVNGTRIYAGVNRFPERQWGRMAFSIPAGVLKAGRNTIEIANITPDKPSRSTRFTDPEKAARDQQWGWIVISEAYWLDPNGQFEQFINGDSTSPWRFHNGNVAEKGVAEGGRAVLTGGEMGPAYLTNHRFPKVAVNPGDRIRLTVKASGKGSLRLGFWSYRPYRVGPGAAIPDVGFSGGRSNMLWMSGSKRLKLDETPRELSCVLVPPKGTGLVVPRIYADNGTMAEVTEFKMELLPQDGEKGKRSIEFAH